MTGLLLMIVVALVLGGSALAVTALIRGQWTRAARHGATVLAVGAVYATCLVLVAVTSSDRDLALGQDRCFDDWCVTLRSVVPVAGPGDRRRLTVVVTSHARRVAQRPDSPVAYLVTDAGRRRVRVPGLDQRLRPGQEARLQVTVTLPGSADQPRLLITEGGFPTRLVIGDENSPWHARSTWPL